MCIRDSSLYMESLGHGVSVTELEQMMHDVGITEDQDGTITEDDFLEFARRTRVADLPASRVPRINTLFERAAGRSLPRRARSSSLERSAPHSLTTRATTRAALPVANRARGRSRTARRTTFNV